LHAAFAASVVFHFLFPHKYSRWELAYVVPGQIYFSGAVAYGLVLLVGLTGFTVFYEPEAALITFGAATLFMALTHRTRTVHERIPVSGLVEPLRIVQLSDIHVGTFMGDGRLQRLAREVNQLKPDMVVVTGDFLTTRSEKDYSPLLRFFQAIERPPQGIFGCLGNHDLPVGRRLTRDLEAIGVRMLINESESVAASAKGSVRVAGLHFYWRQKEQRYPEAFAKCVPEKTTPLVLLCHDPAAFDYLPHDWPGVMLAGHLHGGQVGLTALGLPVSILRPFGMYDQGQFKRGECTLYVHRGTGVYGFPIRIGVPAEIAVIELVPEEVDARLLSP
jgi:predicted MPP superfamily phosphohydrolase